MNVSPQEARAELAKRELARRNFDDFCRYIYDGYQENWHTQLICDALERVLSGEIRFLMIEAPPRHSKSIHVSQLFPAFAFGKDKDTSVIAASYSADLATDHGRETRNIVASPTYQHVFPQTILANDSTAKGKWNTNGKGTYNAAGVGGSITGKGARFFVIDDPFKDREEADSAVVREARWKWLRAVARTRLTPDGAIVLMHTRWHDDDLIGRLTEGEEREEWVDYFDFLKGARAKWVRLTLKAIAERDEAYRPAGEALWPERYPLSELEDIRQSIGPYEWSALYQQSPVDEGSQEFLRRWFKYRDDADIEKMTVRRFATIDTALTTHEGSDYTGVTRNAVNERNEWHLRSARYRVNAKEIIDLIFLLHDEQHEVIGIEEGAFTHAVAPFLQDEMRKRNRFPNVQPLKHNNTMKDVRIRGLVPRYSSGSIFHMRNSCSDLETELLRFPKGTHDDCADSAAYQLQIAQPPGNVNEVREVAETRRRLTENGAR